MKPVPFDCPPTRSRWSPAKQDETLVACYCSAVLLSLLTDASSSSTPPALSQHNYQILLTNIPPVRPVWRCARRPRLCVSPRVAHRPRRHSRGLQHPYPRLHPHPHPSGPVPHSPCLPRLRKSRPSSQSVEPTQSLPLEPARRLPTRLTREPIPCAQRRPTVPTTTTATRGRDPFAAPLFPPALPLPDETRP